MRQRAWRRTRNPHLKVIWTQDALAPPGYGTLRAHITITGKRYAMERVPKRVLLDMLRRPDPEMLLNQLLTMYLPE